MEGFRQDGISPQGFERKCFDLPRHFPAFLQHEQHWQPFENRFRTGGLVPQNSRCWSSLALVNSSALVAEMSLAWHHRPRSPGLRWHKGYNTPESLKSGRVLLIDYVKQGVITGVFGEASRKQADR